MLLKFGPQITFYRFPANCPEKIKSTNPGRKLKNWPSILFHGGFNLNLALFTRLVIHSFH